MTQPSGRCEYWLHGFPVPGRTEAAAAEVEQLGYDGLLLADSQNLVGDVFVELALAARRTSVLGLGTGVVNPQTRHPAVVAGAAATLQLESRGRAVLGVGRGDSSLARLGLPRPGTRQLTTFVDQLRTYVRGGTVSGDVPNRLEWLAGSDLAPVPVELAATGPQTIALGAVRADRVMLTVGADPARIAWAVDLARAARRDAGLDPEQLAVGAYLNVGCHPDAAVARDLVRGSAAIFAHFSGMSRPAGTALGAGDAATVERLGRDYDERLHGLSAAGHAGSLDDAFLDRFAVVGPAAVCAQRLHELVALGLDRVVLVPGSRDADPDLLRRSNAALAADVLPVLRAQDRGMTTRV